MDFHPQIKVMLLLLVINRIVIVFQRELAQIGKLVDPSRIGEEATSRQVQSQFTV